MEWIHRLCCRRYGPYYELYLRIPHLPRILMNRMIYLSDQRKLLETLSRQPEERIKLICLILGQQYEETLRFLFTKEIRLLRALITVSQSYLEEIVDHPDLMYVKFVRKDLSS